MAYSLAAWGGVPHGRPQAGLGRPDTAPPRTARGDVCPGVQAGTWGEGQPGRFLESPDGRFKVTQAALFGVGIWSGCRCVGRGGSGAQLLPAQEMAAGRVAPPKKSDALDRLVTSGGFERTELELLGRSWRRDRGVRFF